MPFDAIRYDIIGIARQMNATSQGLYKWKSPQQQQRNYENYHRTLPLTSAWNMGRDRGGLYIYIFLLIHFYEFILMPITENEIKIGNLCKNIKYP